MPSLGTHLIGFGLRQVLGEGAEAVTGLAQRWLSDPSQRLPKAIQGAHEASWQVLELALQGESGLAQRIQGLPARLLAEKEKRALADQIQEFLRTSPLVISDTAQAEQALRELRQARQQGRLSVDGLDALPAATAGYQRYNTTTPSASCVGPTRRSQPACRRSEKIEGVGPLGTTAIVGAFGDASQFDSARNLSAALGLVSMQYSTGDKPMLLGISKRGDRYIPTLLIHGARAVVDSVMRLGKTDSRSNWIRRIAMAREKNKAGTHQRTDAG